jgi:hypothetical protein
MSRYRLGFVTGEKGQRNSKYNHPNNKIPLIFHRGPCMRFIVHPNEASLSNNPIAIKR